MCHLHPCSWLSDQRTLRVTLIPEDVGRSFWVAVNIGENVMTRQVLAVGIDPAKQIHHAAAFFIRTG